MLHGHSMWSVRSAAGVAWSLFPDVADLRLMNRVSVRAFHVPVMPFNTHGLLGCEGAQADDAVVSGVKGAFEVHQFLNHRLPVGALQFFEALRVLCLEGGQTPAVLTCLVAASGSTARFQATCARSSVAAHPSLLVFSGGCASNRSARPSRTFDIFCVAPGKSRYAGCHWQGTWLNTGYSPSEAVRRSPWRHQKVGRDSVS